MPPDEVEDLLAGEGLAGVLHEHFHDGVLHLRELDALAVLLQGAVAGVEEEGRLLDLTGVHGGAAGAAHEGVYAGGQLRRGKGLGDIVVGAGHETGDLVHLLRAGGEHDDTDGGVGGADAAADLEAVDTGEHDVQQRDADIRMLLQLLQRLLTCLRLHHLITGAAEIDDDKAADAGFVLQDQDFFHSLLLSFDQELFHAGRMRRKLRRSRSSSIP